MTLDGAAGEAWQEAGASPSPHERAAGTRFNLGSEIHNRAAILVVSQFEFQQRGGKRIFDQAARMSPVRQFRTFRAAPKPGLSVITGRR
jgi:hypothetical protein